MMPYLSKTPANLISLVLDLAVFAFFAFLRFTSYPTLIHQASYKINQKGVIKLTKKLITTYLIIFFAFSSIAGLFLFNPFGTKTTEAAWFNDSWGYRKRVDVTVATDSSDRSNVDLYLTVDTTGITANLQTSCEDLRFTNTNGGILPYYIQTCSDNSATNKIWVRANLIPKDSTIFTMYMYYGNSIAKAGSDPNTFNLYNGLQGYWPMNETAANSCTGGVNDTCNFAGSGTNDGAWLNNTAQTTGKFGNGTTYDGTNDNTRVTEYSGVDLGANTDSYTVSAWIKTSQNAGATPIAIVHKDGGTGNGPYSLQVTNSGGANDWARFEVVGTPSGDDIIDGTGTVNDNTWHHIVGVRDNTTRKIYLYVDGSSAATPVSIGTTNPSNNNDDISFGNGGTSYQQYDYNGAIDDVRIYNRALSSDEISQLYYTYGSVAITPAFASEEKAPSPVAYWKFDDGQGTTAENATTNSYDGTLVGTPDWRTEDSCIASKCLFFDGSNNDRVYSVNPMPTTDYTYSVWVKDIAASGTNATILGAEGVAASGDNDEFVLLVGSSNNLNVFSNGSIVASVSGFRTSYSQKWTHIAVTRSGSTVTIYIDGQSRATGTDGTAYTFEATCNLYIGVDPTVGCDESGNTFGSLFKGFIDEPKVYNQALSAAQVAANFNARSNPEGVSAALGANTQNMPKALSDGLVGYWKMEEAGDATRVDSSGNSNTLTESASDTVAQATGKFGYAGDFELADTEYLSAADSASLSVTGNITLTAWINPETVSAGSYNILAKWDGSNESYRLFQNADEIRMEIDSSGNYQETSSSNLAAGTWYHVTGVYNASNATVKIYINGSEATSTTTGTIPSSIGDDAGVFQIGAEDTSTSATGYYDGKVDEARIYNRALSGSEIRQLADWAPGPVGYWKYDENNGNSYTYDSSGTGNNAEIGAGVGSDTNDPNWSAGKYGAALNFDGSNDYVYAPPTNIPSASGQKTMSFWYYTPSTPSSVSTLVSIQGGGDNDGTVAIGYRASTLQVMGWAGENYVSASTNPTPGQWNYVAYTYDGTNNRIYTNGTLSNSTTTSVESGTADYFLVGSIDFVAPGEAFAGKIDDVKVYNYPRTQAQIIEDMNAGHPAPGSPVGTPVGHWKFNEGAENTCSGGTNDVCNSGSVGSAIDGTLTASSRTTSGKNGSAFDGNGGARRGTIADNDNIDIGASEDFSVSFWMKSDSDTNPANGTEYLVYKKTSNVANTVGYAMYVTTSGLVCIGIDDDTTSFPEDEVCSTLDVYDASWHHITASLDRSAPTRIDLYIDGKPNGTAVTSVSATNTLANAGAMYIGDQDTDNNATAGTEEFAGNMDDVKLYRLALSASQAQLDMNQGSGQALGALSDDADYEKNAAAQEYCVPGDTASVCDGTDAPSGKWDFEQGTGTTATDTSGNGFYLDSVTSSHWTTGKVGKAVTFNGSNSIDDSDSNGDMNSFISSTAGTIEAWIYPTDSSLASADRIWNGTGAVIDGGQNGGIVVTNYTGAIVGACAAGDVTTGNGIYAFAYDGGEDCIGTSYTVNQWTHVAWVHTGGVLYLYKNGRLVGQTNSGTTNNLGITFVGGQSYEGKVDQLRMFNYGRTAAQIAWDYNRGAPIAHWKMDECQGTTINDSSGNGLAGTLTNATAGTCSTSGAWFNGVSGKRNYSVDLDTDDYIQVSDTANLRFDEATKDFSLFAWVKRASNGVMEVINKEDADNDGYRLQFTSGNVVRCSIDAIDIDSTLTITDTNWHHVGCTIDRDGNGQVYIDGQANGTATAISSEVMATTSNILLGARSYTTTNYLDGLIDDTRIYNYALTATQVKTLYNEGATRYGPATGAP